MKKLLFVVFVFSAGFVTGVVWVGQSAGGSVDARNPPGQASGGQSVGANSGIHDNGTRSVGTRDSGTDPAGVSYSSVTLHSGDVGWFDGTLRVRNPTAKAMTVLVTVHVYNGEQNVGDLTGDVTLKPNSASQVDLNSVDDYTRFTDVTVDLRPIG